MSSRFPEDNSTKARLQRLAERSDLAGRRAQVLLRRLRKSRGRLTENELETIDSTWQRPDALAYRAEYPEAVRRAELREAARYLHKSPQGRIAYGPAMAYPYRLHNEGYAVFEDRARKSKKSRSRRSR